jgi:ribosomal biogenesis protein LAS1
MGFGQALRRSPGNRGSCARIKKVSSRLAFLVISFLHFIRKRIYPDDSYSPPQFSVVLWSPLLTHIQSHHPDLRSALVHRIVSRLLSDTTPAADISIDRRPLAAAEELSPDPSFDICLSRWAWWLVNIWAVSPPDPDNDLRKDIILTLLTALGPSVSRPTGSKKQKA